MVLAYVFYCTRDGEIAICGNGVVDCLPAFPSATSEPEIDVQKCPQRVQLFRRPNKLDRFGLRAGWKQGGHKKFFC